MIHELKCWTIWYDQILTGDKTYEIRWNDREFHKGDILHLREWSYSRGGYTGRSLSAEVSGMEEEPADKIEGLRAGYCIMSLRYVTERES